MAPIAAALIPHRRRFAGPMDPAAERAYTVSYVLPAGLTVTGAVCTLSAEASALGVEIVGQTFDPVSATVTLGVAAGNHDDAGWTAIDGVWVAFAWTLTLSDGQIDERSYAVRIAQI